MENRIAKKIAVYGARVAVAAEIVMARAYVAFADGVTIDKSKHLSADIGNTNPETLIIGLALWISRLIGTGMLIWGIYGYVTARKDGEAESMNGALGKLISGLVLVCMPSVLTGLGILA